DDLLDLRRLLLVLERRREVAHEDEERLVVALLAVLAAYDGEDLLVRAERLAERVVGLEPLRRVDHPDPHRVVDRDRRGLREERGPRRPTVTVLQEPCLVLNRNWQPITFMPVQSAIVTVLRDMASVLDVEDYLLLSFEEWVALARASERVIRTPSCAIAA